MTAFLGVCLVALIVLAACATLLFRLYRRVRVPVEAPSGVDAKWLYEFSISRYTPMERLLCEEDYTFLASQPGFRPEIARKLRAQRRRIFRLYLRRMVRDFDRIHAAAQVMVVHSPVDSSELAAVLLKQRVSFRVALLAVEIRFALHAVGLGTVDIHSLVQSLDVMRLQLCRFAVPSPELGAA